MKIHVCPYNDGVECREAARDEAKCGKCCWNTDLTILPVKRLTDRFTAEHIAMLQNAGIYCEKDAVRRA